MPGDRSVYLKDGANYPHEHGIFDATNWVVPLRAVGWLEVLHQFTTGPVPAALAPKLVFVAPGGIVHYVESHSYLPLAAFAEAALGCPVDSASYLEALRVGIRGELSTLDPKYVPKHKH